MFTLDQLGVALASVDTRGKVSHRSIAEYAFQLVVNQTSFKPRCFQLTKVTAVVQRKNKGFIHVSIYYKQGFYTTLF